MQDEVCKTGEIQYRPFPTTSSATACFFTVRQMPEHLIGIWVTVVIQSGFSKIDLKPHMPGIPVVGINQKLVHSGKISMSH